MPLTTHTLRQLGYVEGYLTLGLKKEAAEALAEIAGPDRDKTPVLAAALAIHTERSEWTKAAKVGSVLCDREPGTSAYWIQTAYATRRSASLEKARELLMRGVGLHPREAIFHFNLACYEAQLGHLDDARAFLDTACGLDETFVELAKTDSDLEPLRPG